MTKLLGIFGSKAPSQISRFLYASGFMHALDITCTINVVYIESFQRTCVENSLRPVGGTLLREGRVEMCVNGDWGTVTNILWDNLDASVACRQLGFSPVGKMINNRDVSRILMLTSLVGELEGMLRQLPHCLIASYALD